MNNPLLNKEKAALYFSNRPAHDPERAAVMAEVQAYFEATSGTTPVELTPMHAEAEMSWPTKKVDGYESLIDPAMRAEVEATLRRAMGGQTWADWASGHQDETTQRALKASRRNTEIQGTPGYEDNAVLIKEVTANNRLIEGSMLKFHAQHGMGDLE